MSVSASKSSKQLVVHLPTASLPWVTGGREVFSFSLAKQLTKLGWDNLIVFHQDESGREPLGFHEHEGIGIQVLPPLPTIHRTAVYECRTSEVPDFRDLMQRLQPSIVHLHDFSFGANLRHIDEAKAAGAKTVMTYHSPGQSCLQRELLYNGTNPCDGEIRLDRCTACRLGAQGIPAWLRWPLAKMPLLQMGSSRLGRALSARVMTNKYSDAFNEMVQKIDRIQVHAQWAIDLMRVNHVPEEKLCFFRTGLPFEPGPFPEVTERKPDATLRLVMLGRCEPIKGQEVLIDAVQGLPASAKVDVIFYGSYWDTTEYGQKCLRKIKGDSRFSPPRRVSHSEIPALLSQADVMVVPSLWLETGPLVVLEAFAARLPVIGCRLGGVAELVTDNSTGLLFSRGDSNQLRSCVSQLLDNPDVLSQLRSNIKPPRTMYDVAVDMSQLYATILAG